MDMTRRSHNSHQFTNTMINTEIDPNEDKFAQAKRILMDPSQTMLTDYNIADEVG